MLSNALLHELGVVFYALSNELTLIGRKRLLRCQNLGFVAKMCKMCAYVTNFQLWSVFAR